ncbi:hypothetical protein [Lentzea sp. NPDC051838]|uniref:hypothetical protein n=1 Tax=Lentzea sp. NPDC051838 TaxID=3154849 RepID=UPI003442C5BC
MPDPADLDEMLADLRQRGLSKIASINALREAGFGLGEAKRIVHESPVWADRRAGDDASQEWFLRSMFVLAVLGEADVVGGDGVEMAECHDRRQCGRSHLLAAAIGLPGEALHQFRELMDEGLLGRAFTELVAAARNHDARGSCWQGLAAAAGQLLLFEDLPEDEPADRQDWVWAAWEVRRRTRPV